MDYEFTQEELSQTVDLDYAHSVLQLVDKLENKKGGKKKPKCDLREKYTEAKLALEMELREMMAKPERVFTAEALKLLTRHNLASQLVMLEDVSKTKSEKPFNGDMVIKLHTDPLNEVPNTRTSQIDSEQVPIEGTTRSQRRLLKQTMMQSKQIVKGPLELYVKVGIK